MFNSVTDPTAIALVGLVWNSTLSSKSFLTVRFGYNRMSQTIDVNNKVDRRASASTRPLDAADFGVPAVYLGAFGYIGGVGGYPITTSPTQTYDVSTSLTQSREQHTIKMGGAGRWARTTASATARGRSSPSPAAARSTTSTRWSACCSAGSISPADRSARRRATYGSSRSRLHQRRLEASPRVTVSGGLRYDFNTPITEVNNLASNFIQVRASSARRRARSTLRSRREQLRPTSRRRVGRDGRREDERPQRLRAHLRSPRLQDGPLAQHDVERPGARAGAMTIPISIRRRSR
jgi:hypothetical protein